MADVPFSQQIADRQKAINEAAKSFGTPYPDLGAPLAQGGQPTNADALLRDVLNRLAGSAAGAGMAMNDFTMTPAKNIASGFESLFQPFPSGVPADALRGNEAPAAPQAPSLPMAETQALPMNLGQGLDYTREFQGPSFPGAPQFSTRQAKPDYSGVDARLEQARPLPYDKQEQEISHRFGMRGLNEALAGIRPDTPPLMAAGRLIAGYLSGEAQGKDVFDERRSQADMEERKYELMRAGLDEQRAGEAARREQASISAANENKKLAYEHSLAMLQAGQAQIKVGNDGTIVSQQYDPATGKTTVQTFGFEDAFNRTLALTQAKALGGKAGASTAELNAISRTGPLGALYSLARDVEKVGGWDVILTSEEQQMLSEAEKRGVNKFLSGGGKVDKEDLRQDIRARIIVQMLANDPTLIERTTKLIGMKK